MAQPKGLINVKEAKNCILIQNQDKTKWIEVHSYHISCRSDIFDEKSDFLGIVLYSYNGQTQWELNGIRCKSGYIYLCKSENLKDIRSKPVNSMHAKCYKKLFNEDPDYTKIVGAGFAYKDKKEKYDTEKGKEWRYVSGTFGAPKTRETALTEHYFGNDKEKKFEDEWHDNKREMHPKEEELVRKTIKQWIDSKFRESTLFLRAVTWSWYKGRWIDYDHATNEYVENGYLKYMEGNNKEKEQHITYAINMDCGAFQNNKKLKKQYKIYFSAPNIRLNPKGIHSRNNPKWKNDRDKRNTYFLQENYVTKKYRIVRRRDITQY